MIDPVTAATRALSAQSPAALGWVFLAGMLTSIGPCVAPRFIAIAAISNADRRPVVAALAFVSGLIAAFMALGFVAGLLGRLWSLSAPTYGLLALGLIAGGCITLVRAVPAPCAGHAHGADQTAASGDQRSLGAIVLLGAASALVISPCCTPVVAAVVATSTALGQPLAGAELLGGYAAGHALPLLFAGSIGPLVARVVPPRFSVQAPAIVGAVLMVALGIYYGVLA